ncbi:RNAseH domain-containing protein [Nostoc sp. NZL]|nr:RNAseH domain-containing protein [Nostoc sp. NZL]
MEIGQTKKKGVHPKQSIYRAVREACVLEKISSQMVQTVKPKSVDKENQSTDTSPSYSKKTEGRILNAVLDITLRQIGALYGLPSEVYERAGISKEIAQNLDVIALCRRKTTQGEDNIHYALAVRLRATGAVDVLFPDSQDWIPYPRAGIELGQIFSRVRRDRNYLKTIQLKGIELAKFAADVLTQVGDKPTLVLIEADVWRNERGEENGGQAWFQLKNEYLLANRDVLDFQHVPGHACVYPRDHNQLRNLLGIIRFRTGNETTQYITNRQAWNENSPARDLIHLSGFYDSSVPELLHYFSIGRLPQTQKGQDTSTARELYMLDSQNDEYGVNIAFKHQQMLEMLPFFIRSDFQKTEESLKSLCRVPHYLRISPAWSMGNIHPPYPMHLGKQLIKDHLCILGVEV